MAQFMISLAGVLVLAALAWGVAALLLGKDSGLEPAEPDGRAIPLPSVRPLTESDLGILRFDTAPRGYRMVQVDQALRRAAYDIGYKEELIGVLEAEVAALRDGRVDEAETLRQAREAASRPRTEPEPDEAAATEPETDEQPASLGTFTLGAAPTIAGDTSAESTEPAGPTVAEAQPVSEPADAEAGPAIEAEIVEAEIVEAEIVEAEVADAEPATEPAVASVEPAAEPADAEAVAVEPVAQPGLVAETGPVGDEREAKAEPDDESDTDRVAGTPRAVPAEVRPTDGKR